MRQEMMGVYGCSGISWAICKQSAPRSREITTTTQSLNFTGQMFFLTPNQHCHSTESKKEKQQQYPVSRVR